MLAKTVGMCLLSLYSALSWAQAPAPQLFLETAAARVQVLGAAHQGLVGVDPTQTRIVVYAPDDLRLPGATAIFVNGTYHTSLIKGAFSELCYTPGTISLGTQQTEVGQGPRDPIETTLALQSEGGRLSYLRVIEHDGRPVLQAVTAERGLRELAGKRMQVHTLSRVAQACVAAPLPVVTADRATHSHF